MEKREPQCTVGGNADWYGHCGKQYEIPSKLKMDLPFDLAVPLLGLYPKNPEIQIQKNLCTPMFIVAPFTIAKYWKQPQCPSANEWIQNLWYIYTMEFYAAERKELLPLRQHGWNWRVLC